MDLEPIFTQLVNEVLVPIVTTAVSEAMAKEAPAPSGDYITVPQACKILHCSGPTFYDHVHKKEIEVIKNGHLSLVDRQKLLEDLESGKLSLRKDKHRRR